MQPIHPGLLLQREIAARGMSVKDLARALRLPVRRIDAILDGTYPIDAEIAARLGRYFGNGPRIWRALQTRYDLVNLMTGMRRRRDRA